jgi:hypothetical protein
MEPLIKTFAARPAVTSLLDKYLSKELFCFLPFGDWLYLKNNVICQQKIHELISQSKALLEKVTVTQLVKIFIVYYSSQKFLIMFLIL